MSKVEEEMTKVVKKGWIDIERMFLPARQECYHIDWVLSNTVHAYRVFCLKQNIKEGVFNKEGWSSPTTEETSESKLRSVDTI